jgi:hypothetical protein
MRTTFVAPVAALTYAMDTASDSDNRPTAPSAAWPGRLRGRAVAARVHLAMPIKTRGYAAHDSKSPLVPFDFERRDPGQDDVHLEILYCGVCHTDLRPSHNDWGGATFPIVPGHEIIGRVTAVGLAVTRFRVGAVAGVGCMVDSFLECSSCADDLEPRAIGGRARALTAHPEVAASAHPGACSWPVAREGFHPS